MAGPASRVLADQPPAGTLRSTPRFVVVVGTDTGVGKTFVGVALAVAARRAGIRVLAVKPIESGCAEQLEEGEDGARLARASGQDAPRAALLRLRMPVTPALAAEREGVAVDLRALVARVKELGRGFEIVLVESAGGLLSPLSWTEDATDLARRLDASLLLVAADRLGVLHHTRAALHAAAGLPIVGVVLSAPEVADASTGTNAEVLQRLLPGCRVAVLARAGHEEEAVTFIVPVLAWLSL